MTESLKHLIIGLLIILGTIALAQDVGGVEGTITGTDQAPISAATVALGGADTGYTKTTTSDGSGRFSFANVPPGSYQLSVSASGFEPVQEKGIQVKAGETVELNINMQKPINVMEQLTVVSASKRQERIVEAPAAVTVVTAAELAANASHGQLPRLLESAPGVELAQSGVFDFNLNVRGFNSSLNRRILVLIDGRDPATGFLGNQEWSAISQGLGGYESMELVRGPGAALYGANAFNGVLDIRSKRPVDELGGFVDFSVGNLETHRIDFRYSGEIGNGWSYRVNAGDYASDDWSQSRTAAELAANNGQFEYPGLGAPEALRLPNKKVKNTYGGVRIDGELFDNHLLTLELGTSESENALALTGIGRVLVNSAERPWFRFNYNMPHWNFLGNYSGRKTPDGQTLLASSDTTLYEDSYNLAFEIQANYDFFDGRVQFVGGVAYREQDIDTADPNGNQTLMKVARNEDQQAVFGQVKIEATEKIDVILAGRWDDSSLHDSQESPKAAVVYKFNPNNSIRATYNEAFQTPNYSEFFLLSRSANVVPFGLVQEGVVRGGFGLDLRTPAGQPVRPTDMNWQNLNAIAVGNPNLVPEHIESYEVGYKGIVSDNLFITVDAYKSTITNFVTDLLPGVNSAIPAFNFTEDLPGVVANTLITTLQGALGPAYRGLTNLADPIRPFNVTLADGHPALVVSYTNAGEVETEGVELAFKYYLNEKWAFDANYSWFDFEVVDQLVGDALLPNASENKYNLGVAYEGEALRFSANYHYVDGFQWAAGVFSGPIPNYDTLNFNAQYRFNESWQFGLNVTNALDNDHYEIFGGSVNGRRAIFTLNYSF